MYDVVNVNFLNITYTISTQLVYWSIHDLKPISINFVSGETYFRQL